MADAADSEKEDTTTETITEEENQSDAAKETDWKAEAEKWKSLSRKNEDAAKANAAKAKRLDEIEEANKSELDKATARAEAAEQALRDHEAKVQADQLRTDVAKEKNVPADALRGSTREALEEHADQLLSLGFRTDSGPSTKGLGQDGDGIDGDRSASDIVNQAKSR